MSAQSRALLKTWYETGDTPTQAQFADLIDSFVSINDDLNTSGTILFTAVTVQVAELLALNSAPKELIAAPGANLFIRPLSIDYRMLFQTVAYAVNIDPQIEIVGSANPLFTGPIGWLGAGTDMFNQLPKQAGAVGAVQYVENAALRLFDPGGDAINGDSLLELFILYQLIAA